MKKPFFTIITPTLNSEKYLKLCIQSVSTQKFFDFEHIFIDSNSTDDTIKIINEYKNQNPKNVFVYQYPKKGISDAFNKGIIHAKGKYVNFLGSDDMLAPNCLNTVYKKLKDGDFNWCYGNFEVISAKGITIKNKKYLFRNFHYPFLFFLTYICHQTVFTNIKIFRRWGKFSLKLKYAMDYDFFLRIGQSEKPLQINETLCSFRSHTNQSSDKNEVYLEKKEIASKYKLFGVNAKWGVIITHHLTKMRDYFKSILLTVN